MAPEAKEKTIYRRNDLNGEYEPLVTAANDETGTPFGGKLEFQGATPDVQHVVFESQVPLLLDAGENGLYEWESGAPLKLVSVLPGSEQTPAPTPDLGYNGRDVRGAISQDGSRVFWTNEGEVGPLYMRDTSKGETVQVNAAQGVKEAGTEEIEDKLDEVYFQAASSDGARVFFTDTWPLTSDSTLEPAENEEVSERGRPADLYEFNAETGRLSDVTVDQNVGEYAEVLGTLPGVSEDGSYVYFVANGVLDAWRRTEGTAPASIRWHVPSRKMRAICMSGSPIRGPRSASDATRCELSYETPRLGRREFAAYRDTRRRHLAGIEQRPLPRVHVRPGTYQIHNVDANPGAKGAHDEEVFLYDASSGRLLCALCNPSGHAPRGV